VNISVILAVLIALMVGDIVQNANPEENLSWLGNLSMAATLALAAGISLLTGTLVKVTVQLLLARLERSSNLAGGLLRLPGRVDFLMQAVIMGAFLLLLFSGGWIRLIYLQWQLQQWILVDELCLLLPFLIMLIIKWYCFYPLNRFVKEYVVAGQLAGGMSARPVWTRKQYMSFQIRHGLLIILVPLLLIITFKDSVDKVIERWFIEETPVSAITTLVSDGVVFGGAGLIFLLSPFILRRIWLTRSLPEGPLRNRLESFCKQIKIGYRDILLWDTYSAVANAAVMGLLRPVRYVMLSDALIENMSDEQIEAVFGHEAGHVKHHHIIYLLLFVIGSCLWMALLLSCARFFWDNLGAKMVMVTDNQGWFISATFLLLAVGWLILFGWVSRRFERQADIHAAQTVAQARGENCLPEKLQAHGAAIMSVALQRIAMLNGISMHARSWRHSSIASRMAFLQSLTMENGKYARFCRLVKALKIFTIGLVLTGIAGGLIIFRQGLLAEGIGK